MMRKFHLAEEKSPTHANLTRFLKAEGWKPSKFSALASVNEDWLRFSPLISETLEYKHLLASFLQENHLEHLMPKTFYIDDQIWPFVLANVGNSQSANFPWILKPSMLNNGQHIHIFHDLNDVEAHFLSHPRMGGPQVLQRYIDRPQLIQGPTFGHKFSIRELLVVSTHAGSALFPSGYLNIALKPYQEDNFNLLEAHLTNEHLSDERLNVVQRLSDDMAIFQPYKQGIISMCQLVVKSLKKQFATVWHDSQPRIACFGFDFMIEAEGNKLWLLEVNHGPCFPVDDSHPLFDVLYRPFWQQLIKRFIDREPSNFIALD
ncbi:tubulin--tyrosine ligase [Legionella longbeachae]|uniref:Tubulin-tyrosine ligase family protein n=1 Tax=Legionella longbeachae serogroup 1 (strain NSW150) TaxID=661367 RepID=D3HJL0_LEGLN|nr:tubulin--tyrosine ligase [Legionella longbeachae]HBD7398942.1 tubulin-tyrosine ligase [Legionella pneumophila]ARB93961.1 tubulin-tyrosine ligase [Legionella longbeachae]ARM32900.1 tubulin--tyrosine ligase family protein [Legionella longbeachae]EEZ94287.1 putative tubulin-tyrosine ligase family protein [Legionella longbeachae D-4968]QEY52063.1 tubulin--tyrosine ligase family protein [Legionella longbeachae]